MRAWALSRQRDLEVEADRRRKIYLEAQREREEAEANAKAAKTAAERRAATERAEAAARKQKKHVQPPKMRDLPPSKPKPEDMPILLARASFARDLHVIKRSLAKLRENYEPFVRVFPIADIENGHEELMTIAEAARGFADLLRKPNGNKLGHLSVVGDAS